MYINYKQFFLLTFFIVLFSSFLNAACSPAPTLADDDIECTGVINGTFALNDPGGSDIVTLNSVSGNGGYWLDKASGGDPATDGNDTFIAHNSLFVWVLGFGGDDQFKIYDSNFSNLYADTNPGHGVAQRGNDTIYMENSVSNGWILGGNDNDSITIKNSRVSFVASGYSVNYLDLWGLDYTPFDGNDTIILDNVDFSEPNYYPYYANTPGSVGSGKADDLIVFKNGGNAYGVSAGHGNDQIIVEDNMLFNDCNYTNDRGKMTYCGIYGDEPYESEANASTIALHGNDEIILRAGDLSGIVVESGHGSDLTEIGASVVLVDTNISGGDDRSIADGFVDRVVFNGWVGDLNGSQLQNWETIVLDNSAEIVFLDDNLSTGYEAGTDAVTGLPYGLVLQNDALWKITQNFRLEGNLYNNAMLNMQADGNQPTSTLTIANNYNADSGIISLDTVLNDASTSISDKIVVQGDTSGTTVLQINNVNGLGGQTPTGDNEGILIVEVQGYSAADAFELELSPLYAGDYAYDLVKGSNGNWYLQSYESDTQACSSVHSDGAGAFGLLSMLMMLLLTGTIASTGSAIVFRQVP